MTRRYEVVRQTSHSPDEVVTPVWLGWLTGRCDIVSELRAHRLGNREQERGVFYTSRPATETPKSVPWYAARCEHGTQFLNECEDCPGGNPVIPDQRPEPEAEQEVEWS